MTFTPGEYEEFLRLTHATKSASIASLSQTSNASAYLTHSLGPWILDSDASDHLSGNKNLFSSQTSNASAYLTHSLGPWILDSDASDHLSGNKNLFSSLTITSPLPMIALANGTQTMAKGIRSACPLPSLPLTSVLYVPDSPFNLISISKSIHDLNCSITFSTLLSPCRTGVQGR